MAQRVKPLSVCNAGDRGSIPGLGRSPGEGNGSPHFQASLAWKIPWILKPGRLPSMGSQSQTRLSDFTSLNRKQNEMELLSLPSRCLFITKRKNSNFSVKKFSSHHLYKFVKANGILK